MSDGNNSGAQMALVLINGQYCEKQLFSRQAGFDPNTGQPVIELLVQMGFDGSTGAPKYEVVVQNGFNGETGRPVYVLKTAPVNMPFMSATPKKQNTAGMGSFGNKTKSPFNLKTILIAAGSVIAVGIVVLILFLTGVFMSPMQKVLLASYNTLQEDTFGNVLLNMMSLSGSDDVTVDYKINVDSDGTNVKLSGNGSVDLDKKQLSVGTEVSAAGVNQSVQVYYDDSVILLNAPDLVDDVFKYDYTKKNNGYIADMISQNTEGSIEDVNIILSSFWKIYDKRDKLNSEITSRLKDAADDLTFEKTDSKKFEVDGKDRKCKGYRMVITGRDVKAFMDCYSEANKDVYGDDYDEILRAVGRLTGEDISDISMDDLDYGIPNMDEVELYFYIYKNRLAAVEVEVDGEKVSIRFEGGDTRTSRIVISADGEKLIKESSIEDSVEEGTIEVEDEVVLKYSYDIKSGEMKLSPQGEDPVKFTVFAEKGKEARLEYAGEVGWDSWLDLMLTISKGSRISKPEGETVDLGELSEDDIMGYVMDVISNVGNLDF